MLKYILQKIPILCLLAVITTAVYAQQEPLANQYMFNQQAINPAYVGTWGHLGFLGLSRFQYVGIDGAPQSYVLAAQTPLVKNTAIGGSMVMNKIGRARYINLSGDFSYLIYLAPQLQLRLGLKAGVTNYSHNVSQYVIVDPNNTTDPALANNFNSALLPNFGAGAFLSTEKYYIGLSVPTLIENKVKNSANNAYKIRPELRHYYLTGGYVFPLADNFDFKPTFLLKAVAGSPLQAEIAGNFLIGKKVWLGAIYRFGASYGFITQFVFNNNLRIGYSADFATGFIRKFTQGSHELLFVYEVFKEKDKYISPRYF